MADGLVAALARAQSNFGTIVKGHINPHFKSKYADLSDVLAVVRPCLNAEGIALTQPIQTDDDGRVRLYTILEGHGETRAASLPLYLDNMTPQQLLSTLTYYRRGLLAALLGVAAEDDDDGNAAQTVPARPRYANSAPTDEGAVNPAGASTTVVDSYAAAAATPPEKPLAAMTAGEMARYGELIGVRVSGSKADILRTLEPYVKAAEGTEPFELDGPRSEHVREDPHEKEFSPVVAGSATVRTGVNSAMKAEK